jgi:hypothetical protein
MMEGDHLENLSEVGRMILNWIFGKWEGGMDWFYVAQDRDR